MPRKHGPAVAVQQTTGEPLVEFALPPVSTSFRTTQKPMSVWSAKPMGIPLYTAQYGTPIFHALPVADGKTLKAKTPIARYRMDEMLAEVYNVPDAPAYTFNDGIRPSPRPLRSVG